MSCRVMPGCRSIGDLLTGFPSALRREEHIQALLAVRGDASREMRQMIIGALSDNKLSYSGVAQPIFKDITVPTMTMTTMTSMATAKLLK